MPINLKEYQSAYQGYGKPQPEPAQSGQPGMQQGAPQKMSMEQIMQAASGVNKSYPKQLWEGVKAVGLGSAQGLADLGVSALNLPAQLMGSDKRIPHPNLEQYIDPEMSIPFMAGQFIGPGLGKFSGIQKLNKIARPLGKMGIGSDVARGAAVGYALGETGDEGEGRALGAILQGAGSGAGGLRSKSMVNNVMADKKKINETYRKGYKELFDQADKSGAQYTVRQKISPILGREMKHSRASLKKYRQDPSLENAHWLQSDLGKDIRALEGQPVLSSEKLRALDVARKTQDRMKSAIDRSFNTRARPDLTKRYHELSKGYGEEAVPYLSPRVKKALSRFESGKADAKQTLKKLKGSEVFREELSSKFPEIGLQEALKKAGMVGLYGGASALGLGYAGKKGIQYATQD